MAALDDDLMRAIDLTIEEVWRRTKGQTTEQRTAAVAAAMRELLPDETPKRSEPRQWDSADISYDTEEPG